MIEDLEGYRAWLDSVLREVAAEAKRRKRGSVRATRFRIASCYA